MIAVSYCQLTLAPWPLTRPRLVDGVIWYPADAPLPAQAYYVAHEVGHDIIDHDGATVDDEEALASYIGCALLLPRAAYLRDIQTTRGDLEALREMWPLASAWVLARRLCELVPGAQAVRVRDGVETRTASVRSSSATQRVRSWTPASGETITLAMPSAIGAACELALTGRGAAP